MEVLSQDEVDRLVYHTVKHAGAAGIPEDDVRRIYEWAVGARIESLLLAQALAGEVVVSVRDDGEVLFTAAAGADHA